MAVSVIVILSLWARDVFLIRKLSQIVTKQSILRKSTMISSGPHCRVARHFS